MPYRDIEVEQQGYAGIIRLNRPERLNAVTNLMRDEMAAALHELHDAGARAIVVTGEGSGFCSGVDVTTMGHSDKGVEETKADSTRRLVPNYAKAHHVS